MSASNKVIATASDLLGAVKDSATRDIVVRGTLTNVPSFCLLPGQVLRGEDEQAAIIFVANSDGAQLSSDNEIHDLHLQTTPDKRAIFNDADVDSLGSIVLAGVTAIGQVQILARGKVRGGPIEVSGLDIIAAEARARTDRPQGFGVHVLQGAFTLWNMQSDASVVITARLTGLCAGRASAPVPRCQRAARWRRIPR